MTHGFWLALCHASESQLPMTEVSLTWHTRNTAGTCEETEARTGTTLLGTNLTAASRDYQMTPDGIIAGMTATVS